MDQDNNGELKRHLGATEVAMMGLGGALGTGLFLGSGNVLSLAGPAGFVSYILTASLGFIVMFAMGELTVAYPEPGGFGAASGRFLGPIGGLMARWNIVVTCCIAVGAEIIAASGYVRLWFPAWDPALIAAVISVLLLAANFMSVKAYGLMEVSMTALKVLVVIVFIVLALGIIASRQVEHGNAMTNLTNDGGFLPFGAFGVIQGAVVATFSFGGIESASVAAAESAEPEKTIPRAFKMLAFTLVAVDVLSIFAIAVLQPWRSTTSGHGDVAESPFVSVLSSVGIPQTANIMNGVLIVAALSAAVGLMYGASRMLHSLATTKAAPRVLATINANGVPWVAVLATGVGMALAIVLAIVRPKDAFHFLIGMLVFGVVITWTMVLLTHYAFCRTGLKRPAFRLWGAPVTSLGTLAILWCFVACLWWIPGQQIAIKAGLPYLVFLIVASWFVARGWNVTEGDPTDAPLPAAAAETAPEREERETADVTR